MNELRQAGRVIRYHTHPTIQSQSVAAHSHGVAMILWHIYGKAISANLLMAALTHDLAEYSIGDLPAPVKWSNPGLMMELNKLEEEFNKSYDIQFELTEEEALMLKIADTCELLEYCIDEAELGNKGIQAIVYRGCAHMNSNLLSKLDGSNPIHRKAAEYVYNIYDSMTPFPLQKGVPH